VLPAPGAPTLEAAGVDSVRVLYAKPHGAQFFCVKLQADGEDTWLNVDSVSGKLVPGGGKAFAPTEDCVVSGLDATKTYRAKLFVKNFVAFSDGSPVSLPLKIKDHVPLAPGAPVLEAVEEAGSLRVRWAVLPSSTVVTVKLAKEGGTGTFANVNSATSKLVTGQDNGKAYNAKVATCVVKGLEAGASYIALVCASNAFGWSKPSPHSKPLKLKEDPSGVEVTGSRSWAERDAELRKRAIDVDEAGPSASPATATSGVKKESKVARRT